MLEELRVVCNFVGNKIHFKHQYGYLIATLCISVGSSEVIKNFIEFDKLLKKITCSSNLF